MNKYIAKKILCMGLSSLLCSMGAEAQTIMKNNVSVSNLAVSRTENKLFISIDIDVSATGIKNNRELILTPSLTGIGDSLMLPQVMIAGRNRYYHHLRNRLSPDAISLYQYGGIKLIEYRHVIPYESWMYNAVLNISKEICGCCSTMLSKEDALLIRLDLGPKISVPKVFVPQFVYIQPEPRPKINAVKGSAYIDFPVNRTELYAEYRRNPEELMKIRATIDSIKNDADIRILSVSIKGYASPEGSYANNARLAKGRTETLRQYVQELYDFPDTLLTTAYEPEDWAGLEHFVEDSKLKNRTNILEIIRSHREPDAKEWKIKASYPTDYAFLLKEVYPGLRHSDYSVMYEVRAYTDVEEIKRIMKIAPQKLSLQELYFAAQQMEAGSDEYNETFEIAVRMFPDDATANQNAANAAMGKGDMTNAERYLSKAGDTPEATYSRGIYAALSGDYGKAENLFEKAERGGVTEAAEALNQIRELKNDQIP